MFANSVKSLRKSAKKSFNISLRTSHKNNEQKPENVPSKLAADVLKYLDSYPEYKGLEDKLPKTLLRKYKTPENLYLINKHTAKDIASTVTKHMDLNSPLVEVNPGLCLLSQELLHRRRGHIYLFESNSSFSKCLDDLRLNYPNRVTYKIADFFGMWKLAFQDKMDQGTRILDLLGDLTTDNNERVVNIVGSMPGLSFVKHLISNIVFHNSSNYLGRPVLFITMPAQKYKFLADADIKQGKFKSFPSLFQLFFNIKVLQSVPTVHFLPWMYPSGSKKSTVLDESRLLLVNITQKKELPCPEEYLPLLWYFFKPHVFSKTTRIIPTLEQWIPGCGVWLITGQDPPDSKKEVAPTEHDAPLPHMTIFTEFGDLTLGQKLTVFKKFVSLPEFDQCQFRTTMLNNLPKSVVKTDDIDEKDTLLNDMDHSDTEDGEIDELKKD